MVKSEGGDGGAFKPGNHTNHYQFKFHANTAGYGDSADSVGRGASAGSYAGRIRWPG